MRVAAVHALTLPLTSGCTRYHCLCAPQSKLRDAYQLLCSTRMCLRFSRCTSYAESHRSFTPMAEAAGVLGSSAVRGEGG